MELKDIRKQVKRLDYEMANLLNQRLELVLRSTRLRENPVDETEERELREHIEQIPPRLSDPDFFRDLFDRVLEESRRVRSVEQRLAGFQGEHGAYSEAAVRAYDDTFVPVPCMKFVDVFDGVKKGCFEYGMIPVENSLEGGVAENNDLLAKHDVFIVGEVKLHIRHALMALPETDPRGIKEVYSHPQALAQCRRYLAKNEYEARPFYNTAGAARMLSVNRPRASAAIANTLCAKIYDLKIIEEDIQDEDTNFTRFVLIGKEQRKEPGDKCTVVFSTPHECGALNRVLTVFAVAGINLTRIESRPSRKEPGNFVFHVDFQGSTAESRVTSTLENIQRITTMYKFLGCYPAA